MKVVPIRNQFSELISRAFRGDWRAREQLAKQFLRLSDSSAVKFAAKAGIPIEDLIGAARLGLARAIQGFRFTGNNVGMFIPFVKICIRNELLRELRPLYQARKAGWITTSLEEFLDEAREKAGDAEEFGKIDESFETLDRKLWVESLLLAKGKDLKGKQQIELVRRVLGIGQKRVQQKEIARNRGCSRQYINSVYMRALKDLRKIIMEEERGR